MEKWDKHRSTVTEGWLNHCKAPTAAEEIFSLERFEALGQIFVLEEREAQQP